jgi:hypothetical protein
MSTLNAPEVTTAPQAVKSPTRAAGLPPMVTVVLPFAIVLGGCGPAGGGNAHVWMSPTAAASCPPIVTIPGPAGAIGALIDPGWLVGSRILAAAGIVRLLNRVVNSDFHGFYAALRTAIHIGSGRTFYIHECCTINANGRRLKADTRGGRNGNIACRIHGRCRPSTRASSSYADPRRIQYDLLLRICCDAYRLGGLVELDLMAQGRSDDPFGGRIIQQQRRRPIQTIP